MQIVLSPAKLMDFDGADDSVKAIDPLFTDKTAELVAVCREMSIDEIAASMNINPQILGCVVDAAGSPRPPRAGGVCGVVVRVGLLVPVG